MPFGLFFRSHPDLARGGGDTEETVVEGEGVEQEGSSRLVSPRRFLEAERLGQGQAVCAAPPTHIRGAASFPWAAAARAGDPAVPTLRGLDAVLPFPAARPGPGVAVAATMAPCQGGPGQDEVDPDHPSVRSHLVREGGAGESLGGAPSLHLPLGSP